MSVGVKPLPDAESWELTPIGYFIGQALCNPAICTGTAPEWQLKAWFGDRGGLHREEIIAAQALHAGKAVIEALVKARTAS